MKIVFTNILLDCGEWCRVGIKPIIEPIKPWPDPSRNQGRHFFSEETRETLDLETLGMAHAKQTLKNGIIQLMKNWPGPF